jgi:hypothetical protein
VEHRRYVSDEPLALRATTLRDLLAARTDAVVTVTVDPDAADACSTPDFCAVAFHHFYRCQRSAVAVGSDVAAPVALMR